MKGNKILFSMMAAVAMMFVSCRKEVAEQVLPETLSANPISLTFTAASAPVQTVTVLTNLKSWTVDTDASWVSLTPANDGKTFAVSVEDNTQESDREAVITVTGKEKSVNIKVHQDKKLAPVDDTEIKTADALLAWLSNPEKEVKLSADIDMSGKTMVYVETLTSKIDGQGFAIKKAKLTKPLFGVNKGTISNLVLDNTCSFTHTDDIVVGNSPSIGSLVAVNEGTVENCRFSGVCTYDVKNCENMGEANAEGPFLGGMIGSSTGLVNNCKFTGKLNVKFANCYGNNAFFGCIGGVVGVAGANGKKDVVFVKNCTNEGSVSVVFAGEAGTNRYWEVGGVVGGTPGTKETTMDCGIIENCVNKGDVTYQYTNGGGGAYPALGGVVGYSEGHLKSCSNYGKVTLVGHATEPWTGGHAAGVASFVVCGAEDCHNYGAVEVTGCYSGGKDQYRLGGINGASCAFAGVIACAGPCEANPAVVFENCTNEVDLKFTPGSVKQSPNNCYGGVFGIVSGTIKNCANKKSVTVESPIHMQRVGGVAASVYCPVEGCTNSGTITADCLNCTYSSDKATTATTARAMIGGIAGDCPVDANSFTKCSNTGNLVNKATGGTLPSSRYTRVGGILGSWKAENVVTFTDCTNTGTFTNEAATLMSATFDQMCGGIKN